MKCPDCSQPLNGPGGNGYLTGGIHRCLGCDRKAHAMAGSHEDTAWQDREADSHTYDDRVRHISPAARALAESRVDLIAARRNGIPPIKYVPGATGMLVAGRVHHIPAPAKTGKSLAFAIVTAIDVVQAGGVVTVLDRENGADEYVRRLDAVLEARGDDPRLEELLETNLRYHAWPTFNLGWQDAFALALRGSDLVIFDSCRAALSNLRLKENESDDYATFFSCVIEPLKRVDIAVIILDNTGHTREESGRGTTSKGDLADVNFTVKRKEPFDIETRGELELSVATARVGQVTGAWILELGGDHYGHWRRPSDANDGDLRSRIHEAALSILQHVAPDAISQKKLLPRLKDAGIHNRVSLVREMLSDLASDPTSNISYTEGRGYWIQGGVPTPDTPRTPPPPGEGVPRPPFKGAGTPPCPDDGTPLTDDDLQDRAERLQNDHPDEAA